MIISPKAEVRQAITSFICTFVQLANPHVLSFAARSNMPGFLPLAGDQPCLHFPKEGKDIVPESFDEEVFGIGQTVGDWVLDENEAVPPTRPMGRGSSLLRHGGTTEMANLTPPSTPTPKPRPRAVRSGPQPHPYAAENHPAHAARAKWIAEYNARADAHVFDNDQTPKPRHAVPLPYPTAPHVYAPQPAPYPHVDLHQPQLVYASHPCVPNANARVGGVYATPPRSTSSHSHPFRGAFRTPASLTRSHARRPS